MMIEEKLPVRKATITVKNKPVKKKKVVADKDTVIQPTAVSIPQIQVYQPPDSSHAIGNGQPDQIFQGYLKSDQPFTLAVNVLFSLALDSAKISKVLPYQIQGCVTNRKSGDVIQLNQVEDKISSSSELKKTTWLPVVALNSGFYRLEMWVTLRTKPEAMAFFEIPLLQVA
jgi:hypothetical protein